MPASEALLVSCGEPAQLEGDTMGAVLQNHVAVARWGHECADQLDTLAGIVKRFNEQARQQDGSACEGDEC